jgi:hypothetical protein
MDSIKEITLSVLAQKIQKANGSMRKVFSIIYNELSSEVQSNNNDSNNNNNNDSEYTVKAAPERFCIFIMPDGKKIKFRTELHQLAAVPKYEIIIVLGQSPDSLYLESIKKSANLKGADATNYAYEIAAALSAKWLHIWDAAAIMCSNATEDSEIRSYPLSMYRALTIQSDVSPSWYENVAIKHGFSINSTISEIYNYAESRNRLQHIKIAELLSYYETVKSQIESGEAATYILIDYMQSSGVIAGNKTDFNDTERPTLIKQLEKIIEILSKSGKENLVDFLKAPAKSCIEKGYILRSFPGQTARMEIPNILFNEDGEKISEFPYLVDSLIVSTVATNPSVKLVGGKRSKPVKKLKPNPSRKSKFPDLRLIRQTRKNKAK